MKSRIKKLGLLLLLPLFAFSVAHKFYVSVTNVGYSEKDEALQITSRVFIDDLEAVLRERYEVIPNLATDQEWQLADQYIERYYRQKFKIFVNGEEREFTYLGKKYDNDVIISFIEVSNVPQTELKQVEIQADLLTDMFEEQQNIVHFKILGEKRSFVLVRENNKGMLNL